MDDFEYSVQISDRDWERFFAECEECDLLPPSLAALDESGISDIDDVRSSLANRISKDEATAGFAEADRAVNGPPAEHGVACLNSVLSGSEEDVGLQTVNVFFEKLKGFGAPSQLSAHNREPCTLNSLPANRGTADGKETTEVVLGPAAGNSPIEAKASAHPETETGLEARTNEAMRQIPSSSARSAKEVTLGRCSPPEEVKQRDFWMGSSVSSGLDTATNAEFNKNLPFVPSEARGVTKQASQELSPSACTKRRRRRKRRISAEPHEGAHGHERRVVLKQSDSEDDDYPPRGGVHLSQTEGLVGLLTTRPSSSNPSVKKGEDLSQSSAPNNESRIRQEHFIARLSQQPPVKEVDGLFPALPGSAANSTAAESGIAAKTGDSLQPVRSDVTGRRVTGSENGRSTKCCTAEVKPVTLSVLPSASDPAVEASQRDGLSSGQSVPAVEARHSGGGFDAPCQSRNEPLQQLEINHQDKDRYSPTSKEAPTVKIGSEGQEVPVPNRRPEEFKTRSSPTQTSDTRGVSPDSRCLPKSPSNLEVNTAKQQEERPLETQTPSKAAVLLEKCKLEMPQAQADENHLRGISKIKTSPTFSEGFIKNPPDVSTPLSQRGASCKTELTVSRSEGNVADGSCSSVSQDERGGEEPSQIQADSQDRDSTNQTVSPKTPKWKCGSEDSVDKQSVCTMSSFWSDMEKLTIKDILDLRKVGAATPNIFLPPFRESRAAETDSGFVTQPESEQNGEDTFSVRAVVDSNSGSRLLIDGSSSGGVRWESEPVPLSTGAAFYPENMMLTPFSDISLPALSEKCPRKISKNVSVHNLHALDSEPLSAPSERHNLQKVEDKELDNCTLTEGHVRTEAGGTDSLPSSLADSFRISLTDIFNSIFGEKPSIPSRSAPGDISSSYTVGESVSENYDHFFSDFDTETFFCPLLNTADQDKDRLAPVFFHSYSSRGNLQFPEAYDYFFATSSSSDDSSVETDQEDNKDQGPVKVVTRFSQKTSAAATSADAYEDFFTDSDLKQDFFWKGTFSFRNFNFMGSTSHKQPSQPLALHPVRQRGKSPLSVVYSINAPGTPEVLLPDPVLRHVENRIFTQLEQQPFSYKDLQTPAPNPRLDPSLLPLRQSDMCLVCIAFASWVLKSANPGAGDAWKAVLLANVSALSAIRYLRKYVTAEVADSEKIVHHKASV